LAIVALVAVLVLCVAGINAVALQIRCIDAAREAARLVARGDATQAETAARRVGPPGAVLRVERDGEFVVARVSGRSLLLPGLTISAQAVTVAERGTE
jgi:hypothetical protein